MLGFSLWPRVQRGQGRRASSDWRRREIDHSRSQVALLGGGAAPGPLPLAFGGGGLGREPRGERLPWPALRKLMLPFALLQLRLCAWLWLRLAVGLEPGRSQSFRLRVSCQRVRATQRGLAVGFCCEAFKSSGTLSGVRRLTPPAKAAEFAHRNPDSAVASAWSAREACVRKALKNRNASRVLSECSGLLAAC